jgi:hypothetical protein
MEHQNVIKKPRPSNLVINIARRLQKRKAIYIPSGILPPNQGLNKLDFKEENEDDNDHEKSEYKKRFQIEELDVEELKNTEKQNIDAFVKKVQNKGT